MGEKIIWRRFPGRRERYVNLRKDHNHYGIEGLVIVSSLNPTLKTQYHEAVKRRLKKGVGDYEVLGVIAMDVSVESLEAGNKRDQYAERFFLRKEIMREYFGKDAWDIRAYVWPGNPIKGYERLFSAKKFLWNYKYSPKEDLIICRDIKEAKQK